MAYNVDFSPLTYQNLANQETHQDLGFMLGKGASAGLGLASNLLTGWRGDPTFKGTKQDFAMEKLREQFEADKSKYEVGGSRRDVWERGGEGNVTWESWLDRFKPAYSDKGFTFDNELGSAEDGNFTSFDPFRGKTGQASYDAMLSKISGYDEAIEGKVHRGLLGAPGSGASGRLFPLLDKEYYTRAGNQLQGGSNLLDVVGGFGKPLEGEGHRQSEFWKGARNIAGAAAVGIPAATLLPTQTAAQLAMGMGAYFDRKDIKDYAEGQWEDTKEDVAQAWEKEVVDPLDRFKDTKRSALSPDAYSAYKKKAISQDGKAMRSWKDFRKNFTEERGEQRKEYGLGGLTRSGQWDEFQGEGHRGEIPAFAKADNYRKFQIYKSRGGELSWKDWRKDLKSNAKNDRRNLRKGTHLTDPKTGQIRRKTATEYTKDRMTPSTWQEGQLKNQRLREAEGQTAFKAKKEKDTREKRLDEFATFGDEMSSQYKTDEKNYKASQRILDKATRKNLGLSGLTKTITGTDGSQTKIPSGTNLETYKAFLEDKKKNSSWTWQDWKKSNKQLRTQAQPKGRKVIDSNTGDTYYIPKGVNKKRFGKFADYKKQGGDESWDEFKGRKGWEKEKGPRHLKATDGNTYLVPRGVSKNRYAKYIDYKKNGGNDDWATFKSRKGWKESKNFVGGGKTTGEYKEWNPVMKYKFLDSAKPKPGYTNQDPNMAVKPDEIPENIESIQSDQIKILKPNIDESLSTKMTNTSDSTKYAQITEVWNPTVQKLYGKNRNEMNFDEEIDFMYKVGVENYDGDSNPEGMNKWRNWDVYRPDHKYHKNFKEALDEIKMSPARFIQRYNVPTDKLKKLRDRFGDNTKDYYIAAAILQSENNWGRGFGKKEKSKKKKYTREALKQWQEENQGGLKNLYEKYKESKQK